MVTGWTMERRSSQSRLIRKWKPWRLAGVKTDEGKKISRMNAYKHGGRSLKIKLAKKAFADYNKILRQFMNII